MPVAVKVYMRPDGEDSKMEEFVYGSLARLELSGPSPFLQSYGMQGSVREGVQALALELAGDADLRKVLQGKGPSSELYHEVCVQVSAALFFLHGKKIIHVDIKPANLLVRWTERRIFLADFGCATKFPQYAKCVASCGTANYRAPELWSERKSVDPSLVAPSIDVWSFGVTLFEVRTGILLFNQTDTSQICQAVLSYSRKRGAPRHQFNKSTWRARLLRGGPSVARTVYTLCHNAPGSRPAMQRDVLAAVREWESTKPLP